MTFMARRANKAKTVAQQEFLLGRLPITRHSGTPPGRLRWEGGIQPTSHSEVYLVRIEYAPPGSPDITIVSPKLEAPEGKTLPHVFPRSVCVSVIPISGVLRCGSIRRLFPGPRVAVPLRALAFHWSVARWRSHRRNRLDQADRERQRSPGRMTFTTLLQAGVGPLSWSRASG